MSKGLEALNYLEDIAYGRQMNLDPHELKLVIEKELKLLGILKGFGFVIEDYNENEFGAIKVMYNRILVEDEEIDIAKEVLKNG